RPVLVAVAVPGDDRRAVASFATRDAIPVVLGVLFINALLLGVVVARVHRVLVLLAHIGVAEAQHVPQLMLLDATRQRAIAGRRAAQHARIVPRGEEGLFPEGAGDLARRIVDSEGVRIPVAAVHDHDG